MKTRSKQKTLWENLLQCTTDNVSYDFLNRTGRLEFGEGICCDMAGAIQVFVASFDPEVSRILTYAGGKPDMFFLKQTNGDWTTRDMQPRL